VRKRRLEKGAEAGGRLESGLWQARGVKKRSPAQGRQEREGGAAGRGWGRGLQSTPKLVAETLQLTLAGGLDVCLSQDLHPLNGNDGADEPHDAENKARAHHERKRRAEARDDEAAGSGVRGKGVQRWSACMPHGVECEAWRFVLAAAHHVRR